MARGRGYGGSVIYTTSSGADDALLGSAASRTGRIASYTLSDQDDVRRQSRRQDKALLDSITNKMADASFSEPIQMRRSTRLRCVPYQSGSGGAKSYVTYYVGDGVDTANISPRFTPVTPSLSVLEPRYRGRRTYSFYGGVPSRRGRSVIDYLDLHSTYRPAATNLRRYDYLDLSLPLDIHNYLAAGRRSPMLSYIPRYYRSSYDDTDITYRPRNYYLTDIYAPSSTHYTPSHSLSVSPYSWYSNYSNAPFYDYNFLPQRSSSVYPSSNVELQLYPELTSYAPRRRASVSYISSSRVPLAPVRPAVSYHDDIEWPDYRPSAIRFQPLRDGSCPPALGAAPSTNLAVRNARRSLFRIERELGDFASGYSGGVSSGPYSGYDEYDVDYHVPVRRTTVTRTGGSLGALPPSAVRRTVTTSTPKSRYREIEARLDLLSDDYEPPVQQLSTLRHRALDARNTMDRQKVLLDRYLPAPLGPIPSVEYEVESKMPSLSRLSGGSSSHDSGSSSASVKPYSPAPRPRSNSFSGPVHRPSCRPPVSDVRKRCREVLCKTKGDPTYYRF